MPDTLDFAAIAARRDYSRKEMLWRVLWTVCRPLFRYSPRPCFGWRRWLLRCFGAQVGQHVRFYGSSVVFMPWNLVIDDWSAVGEDALIYNLGPVTIGRKVSISQRAHLCAGTHDYSRPDLPLLKLPIQVKSEAWVCADAFVGPGVTIGEGAVVGARAVVVKDVEPWTVVAGNPARFLKRREMIRPDDVAERSKAMST